MGVLDKLAFWKKSDELALGRNMDLGIDQHSFPKYDNLGLDDKPLGLEETSPFDDQSAHPLPPHVQQVMGRGSFTPHSLSPSVSTGSLPTITEKDLELINSKLDTLKAVLLSIEQRIANLERAVNVEKNREKLW